jgi:hypothetical protein
MGDRLQTGEPYKRLAGAAVSSVLIASWGRNQKTYAICVTRGFMGPLGGFWPKLGRKRVTGWKQRSCVPPGRVKTNKQTMLFSDFRKSQNILAHIRVAPPGGQPKRFTTFSSNCHFFMKLVMNILKLKNWSLYLTSICFIDKYKIFKKINKFFTSDTTNVNVNVNDKNNCKLFHFHGYSIQYTYSNNYLSLQYRVGTKVVCSGKRPRVLLT